MISRSLRGQTWVVVPIFAAAVPWLADTNLARADVVISSKPTANMSCSAGVCTPTAKKAVLNVTDLAGMLASGDMTVASGSTAIDIDIEAALSWVSTSRLTLDSYHSINFDKPLTVAGTGALTITVNDGGTGGDFQFLKNGHVEFWDRHSSLIVNGRTYLLYNTIRGLAKAAQNPHNGGALALAKSYDAARDGTYAHSPILHLNDLFEGLGNTISNLSIDDIYDVNVGLFGDIDTTGAWVRDLTLVAANVRGSSTAQNVGVLAGSDQTGLIAHCFVTGQVFGGDNATAGGLVGFASSKILQSGANVAVSAGDNSIVGDLVGENDVEIDQSYATGAVSGGANTLAGGLVGENLGATITNTYAMGTVAGEGNASVGGLIGKDYPLPGMFVFVASNYSTGAVSGGPGSFVGGLIGNDVAGSDVLNTYWDLDTSGITQTRRGAGNVKNDPGITGLTDAQLKSGLPTGFDPTFWGQSATINNGYPYMLGRPPG